jgi:hypothetical protein
MVVFPAASRPTIRILISFLPHRRSNSLEKVRPILAVVYDVMLGGVCRGWKKGTKSCVLCSARGRVSTCVVEFAHAARTCASYTMERSEYACLGGSRICVPSTARSLLNRQAGALRQRTRRADIGRGGRTVTHLLVTLVILGVLGGWNEMGLAVEGGGGRGTALLTRAVDKSRPCTFPAWLS